MGGRLGGSKKNPTGTVLEVKDVFGLNMVHN